MITISQSGLKLLGQGHESLIKGKKGRGERHRSMGRHDTNWCETIDIHQSDLLSVDIAHRVHWDCAEIAIKSSSDAHLRVFQFLK